MHFIISQSHDLRLLHIEQDKFFSCCSTPRAFFFSCPMNDQIVNDLIDEIALEGDQGSATINYPGTQLILTHNVILFLRC